MKIKQISKIVVIFLFIVGCKDNQKKEQPTPTETAISTYYFIRHAEKDLSNPDDVDPELNQSGLGRAMHWAEILNEVPLDAIYTTDFQRTSMTAAPTAVKKDITVQYYDPQTIDINQFKADNLNKNVLVVGHSNTIPDFVNKMINESRYYEMDSSDNGSLFIVQLANDIATAQRLHFNCNCPKERE